jgi:transposase
MNDKTLYQQILGIVKPWQVTDVDLVAKEQKIDVKIQGPSGKKYPCPTCGRQSPVYDHRERRWRHLDTCQMKTFLTADVPRVKCEEHGVLQVEVSWAESNSSLTSLYEAFVISILRETSVSGATDLTGLSWDQVDGVYARAVKRGLKRKTATQPKRIAIDEVSRKKGHTYVTVISDHDTGNVIDVIEDRTKAVVIEWFKNNMTETDLENIEYISMDMSVSYIAAIKDIVPNAEMKICFDRFHVSQSLNNALSKVRAEENRGLRKAGDNTLTGKKFDFARSSELIDNRTRPDFMEIAKSTLKTARAWAIKEAAFKLWNYTYMQSAINAWKRLIGWMARCRIPQMIKVGKTIKNHLYGILNAIKFKASNALAESLNAGIKRLKIRACGFRNSDRLRNAILFYRGGLDLIPDGVNAHFLTHRRS